MFVKNIFIAYLYYLNSKFIQNINIRIGNQIYSNNIFSPYLKYINKSPAELIRNHGVIRSFSGILGHYQRLFLEITLLILILFNKYVKFSLALNSSSTIIALILLMSNFIITSLFLLYL